MILLWMVIAGVTAWLLIELWMAWYDKRLIKKQADFIKKDLKRFYGEHE